MKKFLFLLFAALVAMSTLAAPVKEAMAQKKAKQYLANEMYSGRIMAPEAMNPVLIKTEMGSPKVDEPVYYIYNTSSTFLVISGDDRAEEILMVGDEPLDVNRIPPAMQYVLDSYKEQITYLQEHPYLQVERLSDKFRPLLRAVTYGPFLSARWDQEAPYNNLCKFTYNNRTYTCLTGCPATSAAMVMYYWKYPASVGAMASYSSTLDISANQSVSYTYPALDATTFDWDNMRDSYSSSASGATATAVATLMRYVGQAEKMMYGTYSAGGSGIYHNNASIIATMFRNWGYKSTARLVKRSSYSNDEAWAQVLIGEMSASRPIVFMALNANSEGHAFNVDGYRDSDSKYHVNFGWSGNGNSWYALNAFTYAGDTFSVSQQAIIGIEGPGGVSPTPELNVNPTSLTFSGESGGTYTKTFTVSGLDLSADVNISVTGSSYFTVSPSTLTIAQATAGATVTVTYKPTAGGNHSASINVTSSGAATKTVSVSGSASSSGTGATLTPNPTSLSFSTVAGTPVTQTFTLTGSNLTNTVYLSVSGDEFSIDKEVLTKAAVQNGVTVTVTYNPTEGGEHTGTVTITSTGAATKTVTLNGTATTVPRLVVDPTSLSFSTSVGTAVTKTFSVEGHDLVGNVTLSVEGTGFSIDKNNITRTAATNGTTVTVTYNPTDGGNHTGTVTLNSSGAQPVTVSLSGTATAVPNLTANPTSLIFNTEVGTAVTKTFNVTGTNLTGNVTVVCNGTGFTVDKNTINKNDAAGGATVTVTYNPTAAGNHTGTVSLISSGASTITVSLTGTATQPVRTITATPTQLSFNTLVGTPVTQTFNVSGENLIGNVTLTLSGASGVYSISPTTISAEQAMAGNVPVTVTYNPSSAGTNSGIISLSSSGASTVTVSLSGTATQPVRTLTATPTALTFNTVVNHPVTQTFNVSGENLTGNVTLTLTAASGIYSISPTTITAEQAMAGNVPVTVTYSPTSVGSNAGIITVSSPGVTSVTVTLSGTSTEPARTITATPNALNFNTLVGETVTDVFNVSGENLTGNLTLSLSGGNGAYSISPTTITAAQAMAGNVPVTVTYAPTAFGVQSATVTISGGGAPAATVTLNGQADLVKYAPVMLPAIEDYINLTKFRADWTDETPDGNVASYTLEVTPKPVEPEPEPELIATLSGTQFSGSSYYVVNLTAPWSGENTMGHNNEIIYFRNNYQGTGTPGSISYTVPAGYENAVFTMKITSGTSTEEAVGNLIVSTPQTEGVTHYFTPQETYAWVVIASSGDKITITTPDDNYSPDIALIEVYSGNAANAMLMAVEEGDENSRLITGITDKFYTVEGLAPAGTFLYRVKSTYMDGTESEWSNIEEVTLFGHGFVPGDVNHDGTVNISDVTTLINALLSGVIPCETCADVNVDGSINISDVTTLINQLLGGGQASLNMASSPRSKRMMNQIPK